MKKRILNKLAELIVGSMALFMLFGLPIIATVLIEM